MEVKLNPVERGLMKLGNALFDAGIAVKTVVYRRYDKDLEYHRRTYYQRRGVLVFDKMKKKQKEMES